MRAVLDRKRSATTVVTASHSWAASTAETLAELLRPELVEGEALPDLELLQQLFGRALARRWQRLESADRAHFRAAECSGRRTGEHAEARVVLYRRVVDLRRLLRGIFGAAAARRLLGVVGETSRDGVVLLRQAAHAIARLADASRALPPACFEPTSHDRARWAAPVEAAAETLRSGGARASTATKELEAATAERRRAIADYNAVLVMVAGWLEGTYRSAGRDDRAGVVRPSRRRRGRLLKDDVRAAAGHDQRPAESIPATDLPRRHPDRTVEAHHFAVPVGVPDHRLDHLGIPVRPPEATTAICRGDGSV